MITYRRFTYLVQTERCNRVLLLVYDSHWFHGLHRAAHGRMWFTRIRCGQFTRLQANRPSFPENCTYKNLLRAFLMHQVHPEPACCARTALLTERCVVRFEELTVLLQRWPWGVFDETSRYVFWRGLTHFQFHFEIVLPLGKAVECAMDQRTANGQFGRFQACNLKKWMQMLAGRLDANNVMYAYS